MKLVQITMHMKIENHMNEQNNIPLTISNPSDYYVVWN